MSHVRTFGMARLLVLTLSVCLAGPAAVGAHPFTAYQRNDNTEPGLFQSIVLFFPIGQEFTVVQPCLEAVELYTHDFNLNSSSGATLVVRIHQGTIFSPVVATSSPVTLPDNFVGVTHFDFPTPVLLLPALTYVIDVSVVSGDNWAVGSNVTSSLPDIPFTPLTNESNSYLLGRQILLGMPQEGNDLWFREGASDLLGCVAP